MVATRGEDISPEYCALEAKRNAYGELKKLLVSGKEPGGHTHTPERMRNHRCTQACAVHRSCLLLFRLSLCASRSLRPS